MGDDAPDHAEAFQNARRCERRNFTIFSGTVCNPRRNTTGYGDEAWRLGRVHHLGFNGTSPAFASLKSNYTSLMDNSPCLRSTALDSTRICNLQMVSNFSEETFTLSADCSLVALIWIWTNTSTMWNTSTGWWRYVFHGRYMTCDDLGLNSMNCWWFSFFEGQFETVTEYWRCMAMMYVFFWGLSRNKSDGYAKVINIVCWRVTSVIFHRRRSIIDKFLSLKVNWDFHWTLKLNDNDACLRLKITTQ